MFPKRTSSKFTICCGGVKFQIVKLLTVARVKTKLQMQTSKSQMKKLLTVAPTITQHDKTWTFVAPAIF